MRPWLWISLLLAFAACAQPPVTPAGPVTAGPAISLTAAPVPLNTADADQFRVGAFEYAGGIQLSSAETSQLHGLSDLRVMADGRMFAVSDEGSYFTARLITDRQGRLADVKEGLLSALIGPEGKALPTKQESDAEGLAILSNGDRLVSFERHHRILLYPAKGGPPHEVPSPKGNFPNNGGMEGLAADPQRGPTAYLVGSEATGEIWRCQLQRGCEADRIIPRPGDYKLVALAPLASDGLAYLLRAWDPVRGSRVSLVITGAGSRVVDQLDLQRPYSVENFEGLAALPGKDGTTRFYLLSDDNFEPSQRTLLLAFDWKPGTENKRLDH